MRHSNMSPLQIRLGADLTGNWTSDGIEFHPEKCSGEITIELRRSERQQWWVEREESISCLFINVIMLWFLPYYACRLAGSFRSIKITSTKSAPMTREWIFGVNFLIAHKSNNKIYISSLHVFLMFFLSSGKIRWRESGNEFSCKYIFSLGDFTNSLFLCSKSSDWLRSIEFTNWMSSPETCESRSEIWQCTWIEKIIIILK